MVSSASLNEKPRLSPELRIVQRLAVGVEVQHVSEPGLEAE